MTCKERFLRLLLTVLIIIECHGRPRRFYLKKSKNSLFRIFKSAAGNRNELFCPRNIEGVDFFVKTSETVHGCGDKYNLCNDNMECEPGLMCCPSGCIYKCVVPKKLRMAIATDWIDEPKPLTVGGNSWLIPGDGRGRSPNIDCSTSVFPGIEPTNCPTGLSCFIKEEEDSKKQIPNRGICLKKKSSSDLNDVTQLLSNDPLIPGSVSASKVKCSVV